MLDNITPVILTLNEGPNIGRSLERLTWAKTVIVVDSFSTDDTLEIVKSYPQAVVYQRAFDTHANQWNYGLSQVNTPWVLSLDADYLLTQAFINEIGDLDCEAAFDGYFAGFRYCISGRPLRGTLLPPRLVLFRKAEAIYVDDGHTQILRLAGKTRDLSSYLYHDDRKPLSRWLASQDSYASLERRKLLSSPAGELNLNDRIRRLKALAPLIVVIYCLVVRGGILDGWAGLYYAFQRALAEILLSIRLIEAEHLVRSEPRDHQPS